MAGVIIALDVPSPEEALALVERIGEEGRFYKVGLELYTRAGPSVVRELRDRGRRVFLDLKLHDIPHTVGRAVEAASALGVDLLTVHAAGGPRMLEAARDAADPEVRLLAVTVLTSLKPDDMGRVWGRQIRSVREEVGRLADLAVECGMNGVVASSLEASWLRSHVGDEFLIVTPGIRLAGTDQGDQRRVATPADAVRAGADYLVVGRAVTHAEDPASAFSELLREVREAEAAGG
jgi:orotidine-5'-phosphate decarboxylase